MKRIASLFVVLGLLGAACGEEKKPTPEQPPVTDVVAQEEGDYEAVDGMGQRLPDLWTDTALPVPGQCDLDADCDDGNPCTAGVCVEGECVVTDLDGQPCDDGDACTDGDQCAAGACAGVPLDCDDGNDCTTDKCAKGECTYKPGTGPECALRITVQTPDRGATIHAGGAVEVAGKVMSPAGPVQSLTLNGSKVVVDSDGSFDHAVFADAGVNMMTLEARDVYERSDRAVRAFLYADELYPAGSNIAVVYMPGSSQAFLRADVWDDDNTGDLDDLATAIFHVVNSLDVNQYIPSGLTYSGMGCTWTIDVSQVSYKLQSVDLDPTTGGLVVKGNFINFKAWVEAVAPWCPDGLGWVYADDISFEMWLDVKAANGKLLIDLSFIDVEITGVEVDLQEGLASYFDWMINWFDGTFANLVEGKLEEALPEKVVPTLVTLLNAFLEQNVEVDIPAIPGTTSSLPLVIRTRPAEADFTPAGATFGVDVGIGAKKLVQHPTPGSFKRGDCKGAETGTFYLPKDERLEAAVSEDLVNQLLFALWAGGHMTVSLTSDVLGPLLSDFGITGAVANLDPLLPPIYTSCTESGKGELQLGDLKVWASFTMNGGKGEMDLYGTLKVEAEIVVVPDAGGNQLGLWVGEVTAVGLDVVESSGVVEGAENLMEQLLTELVVNILIKDYLGDVLAAYPIPKIYLGQFPWFPSDATVTFNPTGIDHDLGHVLLSGEPE